MTKTKKKPLEIEKMLVISTGHLRWANAKAMDEHELVEWSYHNLSYGYLVFAGEPDDESDARVPEEILKAMKLARRHGCAYIKYDQDGPLVDCLEQFDW